MNSVVIDPATSHDGHHLRGDPLGLYNRLMAPGLAGSHKASLIR